MTYRLNDIVPFEEDREHEFKEWSKDSAKKVDEYINAFLNTEGGTIYYGVTDEGKVLGFVANRSRREEIRRSIVQAVNGMNPSIDFEQYTISFVPIEDPSTAEQYVLEINVQRGMQSPYLTSSGEAFIRRDGSNHRMRPDMIRQRFQSTAGESSAALHQLPSSLPDFTGRASEIEGLITKIAEGARVVGLFGMGGIGKTSLAIRVAEMLTGKYPDAQIYLDLKGIDSEPLSSRDVMSHVIRSFKPTIPLPTADSELQGVYRSIIAGRRAILLLDNAADAEQIRSALPPATCLLLVTSRQRFTLPGLYSVSVLGLPERDAAKLLASLAPQLLEEHPSGDDSKGDEVVNEIAKLCGYLPLALRATGSLLAMTPDIEPQDFVMELRSERLRLRKIGNEGIDSTIAASLHLSYKHLPERTAEVFCALAVFPSSFDAPAEEFILLDEDHSQLRELTRRSLVEYDLSSNRYRLHDLIRLFADARLPHDRRIVIHLEHASYYRTILQNAKEDYEKGTDGKKRGLAVFDLEWLNIQSGQAWAEAFRGKDELGTQLCVDYARGGLELLKARIGPVFVASWLKPAIEAAQTLGREDDRIRLEDALLFCYALGRSYANAMPLLKSRLKIAQQNANRSQEWDAIFDFGFAFLSAGHAKEALPFLTRALELAQELQDLEKEMRTNDNLGVVNIGLNQLQEAVAFFERQLALSRELGDRKSEIRALNHLGLMHDKISDDFEVTIKFYEQAMRVALEIHDRRSEADTLGYMGALFLSDDPEGAIESFQEQLNISREIEDVQLEMEALASLAHAHDHLDEVERAIDYLEECLALARRGGHVGHQTNALAKLLQLCQNNDHIEEAAKYSRKLEALFEQEKRFEIDVLTRRLLMLEQRAEFGWRTTINRLQELVVLEQDLDESFVEIARVMLEKAQENYEKFRKSRRGLG